MNELLEKIKSMDKKTLIGASVGAVVVVVLVVALVVGLGGDKPAVIDGTEVATEKETERATETLFETVDGTETTEVTEATEATETTETELAEEGVVDPTAPQVIDQGGYVNGVEQLPTVLNPEGEAIIGAGSASQPYTEIADANMTVTTVAVPAGQTLYYSIRAIGGLYCTINDPDAFVIDPFGNRYDANGGSVFLQIPKALASDYVTIQVGNKGSVAKSFVLTFANPAGTFINPTVLTGVNLISGVVTNVGAGNSEGYWYAYAAEATGILYFKVTGCTASIPEIKVTNANTMAQISLVQDGALGEDGLYYIAVPVTAGDLLQISVGVEPDAMWNYPAATITWFATF